MLSTPTSCYHAGVTQRSYHRPGLREALLQRAHQVLAADGVDGLSLRALARELEVSHAAPTRHFADRDALLTALARDGFETLNAAIAAAADSSTANPSGFAERMHRVAAAYVAFATANPALLDLMYRAKHGSAPDADLLAVGRVSLERVAELIAAAQHDGEVVAGDPAEFALVAFAAVHGVAALATSGTLDGWSAERATTATIGTVLRGLAPDAASS